MSRSIGFTYSTLPLQMQAKPHHLQVIESLMLDEETMHVAKTCLGDETTVEDATGTDAEASAHASALVGSLLLKL